ncbi:hypothetical protein FOVG_18377 [Fusarium oxysporum f. sp. pisi HDV247]|uniref:Uncharacterized protein n=1 Tax=Fusarium oxysporum f. sp. pisi HDV247 TaxID=1080344 RepID=W9NBZ8_FUSOX|nr:hypothetical protein FOVG_18377 [Fusarium oxysporum f. sp. pisi HDV247]KAK2469997.1 hypothetical protein H9L39_18374 [Fusarium oxysporum f. sp. albedinis]
MAFTKNQKARHILGLVTPFNCICAGLGAASIMLVILGGERADGDDKVSFVAGVTFLAGTIVLSAVLPVLFTLLNFTYRREMYEVDEKGIVVHKRFPILLWTLPVMITLYVLQFLAGVILWFKSKYQDWSIIVIIAEVFAMSGLILAIAVKAWRSTM